MRPELRILLAFGLVMIVLMGTNVLFPPVPEGPVEGIPPAVDTSSAPVTPPPSVSTPSPEPANVAAQASDSGSVAAVPDSTSTPAAPERFVTVEGDRYRMRFSTYGARLVEVELLNYPSFRQDGGAQLIPTDGASALGLHLLVGTDSLDLTQAEFVPSVESLTFSEGDGPVSLTFLRESGPSGPGAEVTYTFRPDAYWVGVEGRLIDAGRGSVLTRLGSGIALNEGEERPQVELRQLAYVINTTQEGIEATNLDDATTPATVGGPVLWSAFKSKYFVFAIMSGSSVEDERRIGGVLVQPRLEEYSADVVVSIPVGADGQFGYRVYAGPQDYRRMSSFENDLEDVNPMGYAFLRPLLRPLVGILVTILVFLHENLAMSYGWVLILFGIMMRVAFFPLYHKSMKANLRNMEVQPLVKELQAKYKDDPKKMQQEMMKLYKEHGFNPLAGCLPMLLPFPVLIALFFVFQNTIELRGVSFLYLADLSLPDPYYILPIVMGLSMFLLQWISLRSMDQPNPQMKMMMWIMPVMMVFFFFTLPSGLNLYYATSNFATLPQQVWIAKERKRRAAKPKVGTKKDEGGGKSGSGRGR